MDSKKWTEEKVERTLRDVPKIEDERSKEQVLQRLKEDPRLAQPAPAPKKKKAKWLPFAAAAAAIFLLALLIPAFLRENSDIALEKAEPEQYSLETIESEQADTDIGPAAISRQSSPADHYALFPSELNGETVFHIGLVSDQATVVPITFLIPNSSTADQEQTEDSLALYKQYAPKVDQEALGFTPYHPYDVDISADGKRLLMKLPADHSYDMSSAALEMLNLSVQDTFFDFDEILFLDENGEPAEFDQVGQQEEPIKLAGNLKQQAYYRTELNGETYLSSDFGKSFETLQQAMDAMKETPNDLYSTIIPKTVDFTANESGGIVYVEFANELDLVSMKQDEALQLIEGIALTAASFGKQVKFDQIMQEQWNGFDFSKPLEKPIGANPKLIVLK